MFFFIMFSFVNAGHFFTNHVHYFLLGLIVVPLMVLFLAINDLPRISSSAHSLLYKCCNTWKMMVANLWMLCKWVDSSQDTSAIETTIRDTVCCRSTTLLLMFYWFMQNKKKLLLQIDLSQNRISDFWLNKWQLENVIFCDTVIVKARR